MIGMIGLSLDWSGFVPKGEQNETVKTAILVLIAVVPFLGYMIGLAAFSRFHLTRADHAAIQAGLAKRASD